MHFKGAGCEDVDWMNLAQDTNQWRAFAEMMINTRLHMRREIP
jgi:hypothetical protein